MSQSPIQQRTLGAFLAGVVSAYVTAFPFHMTDQEVIEAINKLHRLVERSAQKELRSKQITDQTNDSSFAQ